MGRRSEYSPFLHGLSENRRYQDTTLGINPKLAPHYSEIQRRLIDLETPDVTLFHGGPLDIRPHNDAWLHPIEVRLKDEERHINFHIIALNCERGENISNADVALNLADEMNLKLSNDQDPRTKTFTDALKDLSSKKRIIIRPSLVGSLAFPRISHVADLPSSDQLIRATEIVCQQLNIDLPHIDPLDIERFLQENSFEMWGEFENGILGAPKRVMTPWGEFNKYGLLLTEDVWQYAEVITMGDLRSLRDEPYIHVRIDSGCDIGMLYGDEGCDCRQQLHIALQDISENGGFIIHLPTQDGRGYGMNTKLETEAHKQGIPSVFNRHNPVRTGTTKVAKHLLGDDTYDIRTYDRIGAMLGELGFRTLSVMTDNIKKIEHISHHGRISVKRRATDSINDPTNAHCRHHIEEKHNSALYYSDNEPTVGQALALVGSPYDLR